MAEIVPNKVPCSKKPTPTPKPEPTPVALCDLTGVKYFKLHSDIPGDYTKNCGLLGNEIDENFYFLRSMDIKSAYTIATGTSRLILPMMMLISSGSKTVTCTFFSLMGMNRNLEDSLWRAITYI